MNARMQYILICDVLLIRSWPPRNNIRYTLYRIQSYPDSRIYRKSEVYHNIIIYYTRILCNIHDKLCIIIIIFNILTTIMLLHCT